MSGRAVPRPYSFAKLVEFLERRHNRPYRTIKGPPIDEAWFNAADAARWCGLPNNVSFRRLGPGLTEWAADLVAVNLGVHPIEIWGDEWREHDDDGLDDDDLADDDDVVGCFGDELEDLEA